MAYRSGSGHNDGLSDDLDFPACRLFDESIAAAVAKRSRTICTNDDAVLAANTHNGCHVRWSPVQNRRCAYPALTRPHKSGSVITANALIYLAHPTRFERVPLPSERWGSTHSKVYRTWTAVPTPNQHSACIVKPYDGHTTTACVRPSAECRPFSHQASPLLE